LATSNTDGLTEPRRQYQRKDLQMLKHGRVRNSEKYYLIKGVADSGNNEPAATEGAQIAALMADFEARLAKRT